MADYDFPDDLVQLQRDWFAAEKAWEEADPGEPATAAYRRVHELTLKLHRHPFMQDAENHDAARTALRKAAQSAG